jgi:hypothetical protein
VHNSQWHTAGSMAPLNGDQSPRVDVKTVQGAITVPLGSPPHGIDNASNVSRSMQQWIHQRQITNYENNKNRGNTWTENV